MFQRLDEVLSPSPQSRLSALWVSFLWRRRLWYVSGTSNGVLDRVRDGNDWIMLPCPHDRPACLDEQSIYQSVASSIPLDLLSPVLGIGSRRLVMLRASVPEATIHEHGDFRAGKDDVSSVAHSCERRKIDSVAEPSRMNQGSECQLRLRVATPVRDHRRPSGRA